MPKYTVLSPVQTGGKLYRVGSTLELAEAVAAPLVERGRLERVVAKSSGGSRGPKPPSTSQTPRPRNRTSSKAPAADGGKGSHSKTVKEKD